MSHLLLFGPGYSGKRIAAQLAARGWRITAVARQRDGNTLALDDEGSVERALDSATHILSSVPPASDGDPVLIRHGARLKAAPAQWLGYLSSTGVYGDTGGAWVDETAPVGGGRRSARTAADLAWQALRPEARVFRLPGIYGPGRSALDRVARGEARRIDLPGQVFSRIHVDDIALGVLAAIDRGPAGVYNLADNQPCNQSAVIVCACALLGLAPPPLQTLAQAGLPPAAAAFYGENRRVANGRAHRLLQWSPRYPDYRAGLRAIFTANGGANFVPAP